MRRACACCDSGSFPDRMEMKMMLSTPSTISRNVSVARAIQICGSLSQAIGTSICERVAGRRSPGQCVEIVLLVGHDDIIRAGRTRAVVTRQRDGAYTP